MKLFNNWKSFVQGVENMSEKDLDAWKYLFMFLIVIDLFGVYWFLQLKRLAIFFLLIFIFMLAFLFIVSKPKSDKSDNKESKKPEKTEKKEKPSPEPKESQTEKQEDIFDMSSLGLPGPEEMQKNLDKSLGTMPSI